MKIILLQDVPRVGVKGDIIDVAQAYAMNSFVNKKLARIATPKDEELKKKKEEERKQKKESELDKSIELMKRLEKQTLVIQKKVDEKGHLYAKLSAGEIVDAIFAVEKVSISEKAFILPEIKTLGEYNIEANVNNKKYSIKVKLTK